jgi:hypothetical protein
MDVWIAEWDYHYDMEHDVSVFLTENDALEDCLNGIDDIIDSNWDIGNDPDQAQYKSDIDDLRQQGKLREALDKWNEYEANFNDEQAQYYSVTKKQLHGGNSASVIPSAKVSAPVTPVRSYSTQGATCRGPCKQHNEYANADRSDGTYVCRQCSTFQHIFGAKS